MDNIQEYLQYSFTAIIGLFLVTGLLTGLIRGWKRALIRLGWLAACLIVLLCVTSLITPAFMNMDVSFLNLSYQGTSAKTLKEYITVVASTAFQSTPEELGGSVDYLVAIASMLLNGVIFVIMFFILKYATLVLYKIINAIFIHDKGEGKGRLLGGVIGLATGAFVSLTVLTPFAGYVSLYDAAADKLRNDPEYAEKFDQADKIVDYYKNDKLILFFDSLGLGKYQTEIFNAVSVSKYGDTTFKLADEADDLIDAIPAVIELCRTSDSENADYSETAKAVSALLESNIVYAGLKELSPVLSNMIQNRDFGEDETAQQLKSVIVEALDNIPNLEKEQLKDGLSAVSSVLSEVSAIGSESGEINYENAGAGLDKIIESGLVGKDKIADLASFACKKAFESITEEDDLYDAAQRIVSGFESGVDSYRTEFKAAGLLLSAKDVIDDDFDFSNDAAVLGAKIDETIACNAKIIDKDLINDFLRKSIDGFVADSLDGSFAGSVEKIKSNLDKDFSYAEEFDDVAKLMTLADNDFSIGNLSTPDESGKTLGQKLDEISDSVLVGTIPLDVIGNELDNYADENPDYETITSAMKENFKEVRKNSVAAGAENGYTYEQITNEFGKLYSSIETASKITGNDEFDAEKAATYEKTLDELQTNFIMGENGARALSAYVAKEVKNVIQSDVLLTLVAAKICVKIDIYVGYLECEENLFTEPYVSDNDTFCDSNRSQEDLLGNRYDGNSLKATRVNKPFTYIIELIDSLKNSI